MHTTIGHKAPIKPRARGQPVEAKNSSKTWSPEASRLPTKEIIERTGVSMADEEPQDETLKATVAALVKEALREELAKQTATVTEGRQDKEEAPPTSSKDTGRWLGSSPIYRDDGGPRGAPTLTKN